MIEFKIVDHANRSVKVCEIWEDGKFKAAIYPHESEVGIQIISAHIEECTFGKTPILCIPNLRITFTEE